MTRARSTLIALPALLLAGAALLLLGRSMGFLSASADNALYPPRDWSRGTPGKLNISVFVFSDRNRNGRYDTADKPLTGIAVRLRNPDGSTRIARSNVNGYGNFAMQLQGEGAVITEAGDNYRFRVIEPPGWAVTTGNADQRVAFRTLEGSITGLVADRPPAAVGLSPDAVVRGQLRGDVATATVTATGGEDNAAVAEAGGDSRYELRLRSGRWTITGTTAAEETRWSRDVLLDFAPVVLGAPLTSRPQPLDNPLVTVGFDDLTRSYIEKVAAGYGGLAWDYLLAVDNQFYKGPGYVNGLMSGSRVAYNSSGHPVTITALEDGGHFDFVGGFFTAAWPDAEGETLIARAWQGGRLLAEDQIRLSHLGPVYFQAGYGRITRLEFATEHYWQFVVDDLQFRVPAPTEPPRP